MMTTMKMATTTTVNKGSEFFVYTSTILSVKILRTIFTFTEELGRGGKGLGDARDLLRLGVNISLSFDGGFTPADESRRHCVTSNPWQTRRLRELPAAWRFWAASCWVVPSRLWPFTWKVQTVKFKCWKIITRVFILTKKVCSSDVGTTTWICKWFKTDQHSDRRFALNFWPCPMTSQVKFLSIKFKQFRSNLKYSHSHGQSVITCSHCTGNYLNEI